MAKTIYNFVDINYQFPTESISSSNLSPPGFLVSEKVINGLSFSLSSSTNSFIFLLSVSCKKYMVTEANIPRIPKRNSGFNSLFSKGLINRGITMVPTRLACIVINMPCVLTSVG